GELRSDDRPAGAAFGFLQKADGSIFLKRAILTEQVDADVLKLKTELWAGTPNPMPSPSQKSLIAVIQPFFDCRGFVAHDGRYHRAPLYFDGFWEMLQSHSFPGLRIFVSPPPSSGPATNEAFIYDSRYTGLSAEERKYFESLAADVDRS